MVTVTGLPIATFRVGGETEIPSANLGLKHLFTSGSGCDTTMSISAFSDQNSLIASDGRTLLEINFPEEVDQPQDLAKLFLLRAHSLLQLLNQDPKRKIEYDQDFRRCRQTSGGDVIAAKTFPPFSSLSTLKKFWGKVGRLASFAGFSPADKLQSSSQTKHPRLTRRTFEAWVVEKEAKMSEQSCIELALASLSHLLRLLLLTAVAARGRQFGLQAFR